MAWTTLLLTFVVAVCIPQSESCSCMDPGDLADNYCDESKELILHGIVLNSTVVATNGKPPNQNDVVSYAFGIITVVKAAGNSSKLIEGKAIVYVNATTNGALCGTSLTLGEQYVIAFASSLSVSLCSWKRTVARLSRNDIDVIINPNFNCAAQECNPMPGFTLMCCRRGDKIGSSYCVHYEDGLSARCCTALSHGPMECVDYSGSFLVEN
ncbi:uncharacterized protein [Argopecten irradians]|uniref:uncharacterized protein isoform X2 n=1 Tax=Argopecten irradians TaxID=31199 RepID=UPI0037227B2C